MADWNSELYLRFAAQRTQPAIDLASRLTADNVCRALDIGCGPGNSTAVVMDRYPKAEVTGVDSSRDMLARARADHPGAQYVLCDVSSQLGVMGGDWDVIFSNACLQWVPDHPKVLSKLMSMLRRGGQLAVQMPVIHREPIQRIVEETASSPQWSSRFGPDGGFGVLEPEEYYDLLSALSSRVDIWQTTYYHVMPSHESILEWYRSTGLKPYLDLLTQEEKTAFEAQILEGLRRGYPTQADGTVLFLFPRLFFIAEK